MVKMAVAEGLKELGLLEGVAEKGSGLPRVGCAFKAIGLGEGIAGGHEIGMPRGRAGVKGLAADDDVSAKPALPCRITGFAGGAPNPLPLCAQG